MASSAHPAPELVELGETKTVCAVDQHYRGVGNIDADLNYRRGDQYVEIAVLELLHDLLFFAQRQASVEESQF